MCARVVDLFLPFCRQYAQRYVPPFDPYHVPLREFLQSVMHSRRNFYGFIKIITFTCSPITRDICILSEFRVSPSSEKSFRASVRRRPTKHDGERETRGGWMVENNVRRGGASNVQTTASPISRLVVKHRALDRFRGAARLCRCFRPRRRCTDCSDFIRRLREHDEKADHLWPIETESQAAVHVGERGMGS